MMRELVLGLGTCRGGSSDFFAASALDAGCFTLEVAQVIEASAAHFALADHFDGADRGRVEREDALDADAKADAAHREGGAGGPALLGDHHAFECLKTFLNLFAFTFLQADIDADRVARTELRQVFAQLRFMELTNYRIHVRVSF